MECPVRFYGPSRIPGVFCKKVCPARARESTGHGKGRYSGARLGIATARAGESVGRRGPDFSRSGSIARRPCVLPGQAVFRICMLKNYTERNGTQDVSGQEGKMRGQSGRWGSSSACFCFYRAILISVLRRNALRDGLLRLLFMGNNTFIKQAFNRHSKRMSNSFQCFQVHFSDSAAPGAGV